MLRVPQTVLDEMVAHALDAYPLEACGFLVGVGDDCRAFVPTDNVARSAKVYEIDPRQHLRTERDAEDRDEAVVGVMHSHTHTDAFPSATDIAAAPDPGWHYVIVSLRDDAPSTRSYRIVDGVVTEEFVDLGISVG